MTKHGGKLLNLRRARQRERFNDELASRLSMLRSRLRFLRLALFEGVTAARTKREVQLQIGLLEAKEAALAPLVRR